VTLFDGKEIALAANEKALAWICRSRIEVIDGEPEVTTGNVLVTLVG
jgi:hypothetical protein